MSKRMRRGRRDITISSPIANRQVVAPTVPFVHLPTPPIPTYLDDWGNDRRRYKADYTVAPASPNRNASRVVVDKFGKSVRAQTKAPLRFNIPNLVTICAKRALRKEVLHALGKTGRRGFRKKPRRNFWSAIVCDK